MNPQTYIFIGRSGCGKGTQAALLQEHLKNNFSESPILYLETGQSFRKFIDESTYTSGLSKKIYHDADPQPEFLAIWMWSHFMVEDFKGNEHLVIDGTPRSYPEALVLSSALKFYNRRPTVIYINVGREWSEERLKGRGRIDDVKAEDVKKRLDWFDSTILPAVEYFRYSKDCNFLDINGERTIEEIHQEMMTRIAA
ncbi:nucleoside monophosphate kinase [Patescibacteria group bacterium]|nr:nucleoside monophosphate kinase [Patescibacteria group bacterium]